MRMPVKQLTLRAPSQGVNNACAHSPRRCFDGALPESMKLLVNVLVHEIDAQCKQPTGGPRYWSGRLWRWFFAKVSPGIVAAILAPLLMGAVLFVRAWFAG